MDNKIPMTSPPAGVNLWMERPPALVGSPLGLEYIAPLEHLKIEILDFFSRQETNNKFVVKNSMGQQCYYSSEEWETCNRHCGGDERGFAVHVVDNRYEEVIRVEREWKCCVGYCWCINGDTCAHVIDVQSPVGVSIGRIVQRKSSWKPRYAVQSANNETLLLIEGPCSVSSCCCVDDPFNVFTADGKTEIGAITHHEYDNSCGVTFPVDLDVKVKAILLAATFLIIKMYFPMDVLDEVDDTG